VTVAVLDSGFRGVTSYCGGVLPRHIGTRSFRRDGNLEAKDSQHGILCAEVVHTLAPDASLLMCNWETDREQSFLAAVRWARQKGAKVLTCSVIMPSWSDGDGGGEVHAELARLLGDGTRADHALFFACAGNTADRHFSAPYRPDHDGWHQWQPGVIDNVASAWGEDRVSVELCWKPGCRYQLSVRDEAGAELPAVTVCGTDRCTATVRFKPAAGSRHRVRVRLLGGKPCPFHLTSLGAWLERHTMPGSIPFPGDGPEVVTVGAVDGDGRRMGYSSCGSPSRAAKPDLVAKVPVPTRVRSRPFSGTSAATPQAAAAAALVWSRNPTWSARQVRDAVTRSTCDLGPPGHDAETGHGLLRFADLMSPATRRN
jgi:subtilisin family serine protease